MPKAVVAAIASSSSAMKASCASSRSDFGNPAWYARARRPASTRAAATSSAPFRVAT